MTIYYLISLFPVFMQAFSLNIVITLCAMALGIMTGLYITKLYLSRFKLIQLIAKSFLLVFRNVPSFVLLFYLALIIPTQFSLASMHFQIPVIAKAIFALGAPVTGFACGYFLEARTQNKAFQLAPWSQYFIVILMASTTSSIIGVKEIMATANATIAISGDSQMVIPIYSLVALWFISCSLICSWLIKRFDQVLLQRFNNKAQLNAQEGDKE
ncbi:hypothetical protein [Marinomonas sp. S3726]|uniref:hypothetical protein n=1 Tax=Marinomonas sp. S3726 TaxID=579484 RepID=UPI0005FA758A|nr:hypothetical protein [Marinomonas sp. S3726]